MSATVVAEVIRSGFVEGRHCGSVVRVGASGEVEWAVGDPGSVIFPRSCNKPLQAAAMVRAGLRLAGSLLAVACGSHSGEPFHLDAVREILGSAGLTEDALHTPPAYPLGEEARAAYLRSGGRPSSLAMNCSGKHAAMLATCVGRGWDPATYLDPDHPLAAAIASTFEELTGEPIGARGVDGCGAPLYGTTLVGLARAFSAVVRAAPDTAEGTVAAAVSRWPEHVSGTGRDEALLLGAFPGAIAKAGAEACYAVAMPDGTAYALKIDDGGVRARAVVMAAALRLGGHDHPVLDEIGTHLLLGGTVAVGEVRATLG